MRLNAHETMVMAVDFQERLMPVIADSDAVLSRARLLLEGLNLLHIPMLVTRQYPKGLGDTVPFIREMTEGAPVLDKTHFGACDDPAVLDAVRAVDRKNVIICGAEAHICVLQTVMGLQAAGFQAVLVEDCVGSRQARDKETGLKRAMQEGALITSCEAVLFELLAEAGSDTFKQISRLVK